MIATAFLISAWQIPPDPAPRERVVPITFQQIPEFRVEPAPEPRAQRSAPAPRAATPAPRAAVERTSVAPPPTPPPPLTRPQPPQEDTRTGEPGALPRRESPPTSASKDAPGGSEGRSGGFDVQSALREFGRNLRSTEPKAGDDGGGKGAGSGRGTGAGRGLSVPDLTALPSSGFGFGNLEFESKDFDWKDYARQIYVAIWRAWHNRLYLTSDAFEKWSFQNQASLLDHQNRIRFTIERNGEVSAIVLETPSGCVPLDDSALDALHEVVLPPLPSDFARDQETIHARFLATGEIRYMRPSLQQLRDRGYF